MLIAARLQPAAAGIPLLLLAVLFTAACGEPQAGGGSTLAQEPLSLQLPKPLREVSALAVHDGFLFTMGDEVGQVYRIEFPTAKVSRWLSFGQPPEPADFEGLAVLGDALYATTSKGVIYQSNRVTDRDATGFDRIKTGLSRDCEIEGLTALPEEQLLLLLCKTPYKDSLRDTLNLFAWSVADNARVPSADIRIPYSSFVNEGDGSPAELSAKRVAPSAVSLVPGKSSEQLWVLSARNKLLLKIPLGGGTPVVRKLPDKKLHRQAEGLIHADGVFYVANEAGKKGKHGTITRYRSGL